MRCPECNSEKNVVKHGSCKVKGHKVAQWKCNGIGIELRQDYFEIARRRISEAQAQMTLPIGY